MSVLERSRPADVGAVSVSRQPENALDEFVRRARRDGASLADMHPRSIFEVDLCVQEAVDLSAAGSSTPGALHASPLIARSHTV